MTGESRRRVLELYTLGALRCIAIASAAAAVIAYSMWAINLPVVNGIPWRPITIAPFAMCLARYGLVLREGGGEAPEDLILSDRWLLLAFASWLLLFSLGVAAS